MLRREYLLFPGSWLEGNDAEVTLQLPLNRTGVFFRGGSIIVGQDVERNSEHSRLLPITFHVFLDQDERAEGDLYMDDGSSIGETLVIISARSSLRYSSLGHKYIRQLFSKFKYTLHMTIYA